MSILKRLIRAEAIAIIAWTAGCIAGGVWVAVLLTVPRLVPMMVARFL